MNDETYSEERESMFWANADKYHANGQQMRWAARQIYKLYGEYLENLRKPYPEHLLKRSPDEKQRLSRQGGCQIHVARMKPRQ